MVDFYKVLGVNENATPEEIKKAFQQKAFQHHPDRGNPENAKDSHHQFREVTEAYQVLRDKSKRAQYDTMRRAGFTSVEDYEASAAYGQSPFGGAGGDFDKFDEWWKRMSAEFREYAEEQVEKEKMAAERMERAAAWEREKEEAKLNKARAERLRQRTEDARHLRHAAILRRFWQTHGGLTWWDAGFISAATLTVVGLGYAWKLHLGREGRPQRAQQAATTAAAAAVAATAT